jgi:ATP-binding cassette subfamily B protein
MWKLRRFLYDYKKELILGPAFKFTEAVLELIIPLIMAKIIDIGVGNSDVKYIIKMGFVLVLLGAVGFGCASVCQYYASAASQGSGTVLRNELFRKITTLRAAELDRFGTNRLTAALTGDTYTLQYAVAMLIRLVIRSPFIAFGSIITAVIIDPRLSLVILAVTPLLVFVIYIIMSRTIPFYRRIRGSLDRVAQITRENLTGTRVVRSFSKEEYERSRFRRAGDTHADITAGAARLSALLNPLTYVIMNLGIAAVIWFGGFRVDSGNLTQGELIAFINYMTQIMSAVIVTAGLVVTFTRASASASRISEILETDSSVPEPDSPDITADNPEAPAVRLKGVTFSYGGKPALRDISLVVPRGSTLGIVGGTGSGKSTVIRLIMRFYDTGSGTVEVNGIDARHMPIYSLRNKIGYVPQRAELLPGTIAENIRMGDVLISDQDIENALRTAQGDFVFTKENGIYNETEQDGRSLSGGQRQRITIARALARKPEILIFDDCFSALDTETDFRIRRAIAEKHPQATKIIISQRASAVKSADHIAVMEDGALIAAGTHRELLLSCPIYAEIVHIGHAEPENIHDELLS